MSPSRKKRDDEPRSGDEPRRAEKREASGAGGGGATRSKRSPQRTSYESRGGAPAAPDELEREKEYPKPPLPKQHQESPGLESRVTPRPKFEAPAYKAAGKLPGKAALITGGDSGIGRAVAVLYAREGADVAIVYLPQEQSDAEETQQSIEAEGGKCVLIPGDLTDADFCSRLVEKT